MADTPQSHLKPPTALPAPQEASYLLSAQPTAHTPSNSPPPRPLRPTRSWSLMHSTWRDSHRAHWDLLHSRWSYVCPRVCVYKG